MICGLHYCASQAKELQLDGRRGTPGLPAIPQGHRAGKSAWLGCWACSSLGAKFLLALLEAPQCVAEQPTPACLIPMGIFLHFAADRVIANL